MFCQKCGVRLEDDAKFCENCGSPTGVGQPVADYTGTASYARQNYTGKIIGITCAVVGIAAVAIAAWKFTAPRFDLNSVRNHYLAHYESKTLGDALESYFSNEKWDSHDLEEYQVILFTGEFEADNGSTISTLITFDHDAETQKKNEFDYSIILEDVSSGQYKELTEDEYEGFWNAVYYGDVFSWMWDDSYSIEDFGGIDDDYGGDSYNGFSADYLKNSYLYGYETMTLGEAIDRFFISGQWGEYESQEMQYVSFTGDIDTGYEVITAVITFEHDRYAYSISEFSYSITLEQRENNLYTSLSDYDCEQFMRSMFYGEELSYNWGD